MQRCILLQRLLIHLDGLLHFPILARIGFYLSCLLLGEHAQHIQLNDTR